MKPIEKLEKKLEKLERLVEEAKTLKLTAEEATNLKNEIETLKEDAQKLMKQAQAMSIQNGAELAKTRRFFNSKEAAKEFLEVFKNARDGRTVQFDLNTIDDSLGGYLSPTTLYQKLLDYSIFKSFLLKRVTQLTMASATVEYVIKKAGPDAYWITQGTDITASDFEFDQKEAKAQKIAALVQTTNEFNEDAVLLEANRIAAELGDSIKKGIEASILNGVITLKDGSTINAPADFDHIFNNTAITTVNMESGKTSAYDLTFDHLLALLTAVDADTSTDPNSVFVGSITLLHLLRGIKDANGNPIFAPPSASTPTSIFGFEFGPSAFAPAVQNVGAGQEFVVFGDLSKIYFGTRSTLEVKYDDNFNFAADMGAYRATLRCSSVITKPEALATLATAAS